MDDFRLWWAKAIRGFLAWVSSTWQRFSYGIMHDWNVMWFILGLGVVLIIGLAMFWRRRA